jgi:hypothetical protein
MKLKISRDYALLLNREYLPNIVQFSHAREKIYPTDSDEHWNARIITGVCESLACKFSLKIMVTEKAAITFKFTDAEVFTLYKFLLHFPIPDFKDWECMMRDLLIAKIHQYIVTPMPFLTYNLIH